MNIDAIQNGIVIDHITAGRGMRIYELLGLDALDVSVALIKNAVSHQTGGKICGNGAQYDQYQNQKT